VGHTCYSAGEEGQFYTHYKNSSCGDKTGLIGTIEKPAVLTASMSTKHGRLVPFDLSQPQGTSLFVKDAIITGVHRMWVSQASFERVTFMNNSGWANIAGE
jgi:hypothetical protein